MSLQRFYPIYRKLPVWLQTHACWFYGRLFVKRTYTPRYYEILSSLLESEKWSRQEIEAYQDEQIKKLISGAYANVQYYREVMDGLRLRPNDIKTVGDLVKLPVLHKETIRNNMDKFVSRTSSKGDLIFRHTSGTTGKSLHFYVNKETELLQWAIWWRHRRRFGMTNDSWHVNFSPKPFVPGDQERPPYWRWVNPMKQLILSMHHLTPPKIRAIVDFLNRRYFEFYTAFPSIVHIFAVMACEAGLRLINPPRVIFMNAENTLDFQKTFLEDFIGASIVDQYGFSEACGNASQCECGLYHEDFELGVFESLDTRDIPGGRARGRIVATGFTCHEFPFIRYDVGDIGVWENPQATCRCGRQSRLMVRVEGREDDYVVTPEGRRLMRFDFIFKDTRNCSEAQIVQEDLGKIKIVIVRRSAYSSRDERFIRNQIKIWISETIEVEFVYVPHIQREASGKFRAVKSLLGMSHKNVIPDSCEFLN